MRKPVVPTIVWGLLLCCNFLNAQSLPDFSQVVVPDKLTADELAFQLDTTNDHRHSVGIRFLQADFPDADQVMVETYYQKSERHLLLELSKGHVPIDKTYLITEGHGTTYWKVGDGHCWVLLGFLNQDKETTTTRLDKGCLE